MPRIAAIGPDRSYKDAGEVQGSEAGQGCEACGIGILGDSDGIESVGGRTAVPLLLLSRWYN